MALRSKARIKGTADAPVVNTAGIIVVHVTAVCHLLPRGWRTWQCHHSPRGISGVGRPRCHRATGRSQLLPNVREPPFSCRPASPITWSCCPRLYTYLLNFHRSKPFVLVSSAQAECFYCLTSATGDILPSWSALSLELCRHHGPAPPAEPASGPVCRILREADDRVQALRGPGFVPRLTQPPGLPCRLRVHVHFLGRRQQLDGWKPQGFTVSQLCS